MSLLANVQALIEDNFRIYALFQVLIADSCDILALLQVLIAKHFGILALFQALIEDNFGIFNTLGKNKHHPGLKHMTSATTSRYSTNSATKTFYIKEYRRHETGDVGQKM